MKMQKDKICTNFNYFQKYRKKICLKGIENTAPGQLAEGEFESHIELDKSFYAKGSRI